MTRMHKLVVGFLLAAAMAAGRPASAAIVHRYLLNGDTNDSVGSLHLSAVDDFAPDFVADNAAGGMSAEFTGVNAVLGDVPSGDPLRSTVYSLAFWIKYGDQPSGFGMPIARADGTNVPWVAQINPDGSLRWIVQAANVGDTAALNTGGGDADPWRHVVLSQNHDVASIYIDGVAVHQNVSSPISSVSDAKPLRLGRRGDGYLSAGRLDDVQIYADALQPNDVAFLYANPGQIVVPDPLSTDFDGLNGTDINDFHVLRSNFLLTSATHAQGDADLNGTVNHRDYFMWRTNSGREHAQTKRWSVAWLENGCSTAQQRIDGVSRRSPLCCPTSRLEQGRDSRTLFRSCDQRTNLYDCGRPKRAVLCTDNRVERSPCRAMKYNGGIDRVLVRSSFASSPSKLPIQAMIGLS